MATPVKTSAHVARATPASDRMAHRNSTRVMENRRPALLAAAADLFGQHGYAGTSIRDIASAVGMLPGSLYYHFRSKDELLLEVHREGVRHFHEALTEVLDASGSDPMVRLQAGAVAHLSTLLGDGRYARIVTPDFARSVPDPMRAEMIAERDAYERRFVQLIDDLDLPPEVDRSMLRLTLFGALNWSLHWFNPTKKSPDGVARSICKIVFGDLQRIDAN